MSQGDTTTPLTEAEVRADERARLAALLEENAETIGGFTGNGAQAVRAVAFLIQLGP